MSRNKCILITGMSGTGKSTVVVELRAKGFSAIDLDTPEWLHWVESDPSDTLTPIAGKDWVWQEDPVRSLLSAPRENPLFISGCSENMRTFFPLIDEIILLSAPRDIIRARLAQRAAGAYGRQLEDQNRVIELISTVEPLLRRSAHHEIATTGALSETLDRIIKVSLGLRTGSGLE